MAKLKLFFSGRFAREGKCLDQTLQLLWELDAKGMGCNLVDTDGWTEEQFRRLYREAMASAILNRHGIRQAFGSRGDGRSEFGKYTPALMVYDGADCCLAVYPHLERETRVDILEYLTDLLRGRGKPIESMTTVQGFVSIRGRALCGS